MQENSENTVEEQENMEIPVDPDEPQVAPPTETEKPDVTAALTKKIEEFELVNKNLQNELTKKTDVINEMEKAKLSLEKEFTHLKRERENAVLRYAVVEKQVLDAKNAKETFDKKNKELLKEHENMSGKIKSLQGEKTKICGMLEAKCTEVKTSHRDVEKLKYDISCLESRLKYSGGKIKSETDAREAAERKIEELNAEIKELKLKEISREKEELEVERNMLAERQMIEQNATLILLKHQNEEKGRRSETLERKCHQLETDLEALNSKHTKLSQEYEKLIQDNSSLYQQVNDSQCLLDKQMMKIAELQSNQNDLEIIRTQLTLEKNSTRQLKNEIAAMATQVEEQNLETEKWRAREIELLQLNKELTETVVKLKNESSMNSSKAIAVTLENESIRKEKNYYEAIISDLKKQIEDEVNKRNSDCQLMAKHISEKTKQVENLQRRVEELTCEMEAHQRKYSQSVKELTREINLQKKRLAKDDEHKGSPTPSTTSESSFESHSSEYPTISIEPSQKTLIDRIVRLQNEIVRQSEKIDFLENHQAQLVEELKRLRKINKK